MVRADVLPLVFLAMLVLLSPFLYDALSSLALVH